jgi:ABC-2 type transport system ATP-binding protein
MFLLHEPTLALDQGGRQKLLDLLQPIMRERNIAVVLCSHLLTEMEQASDVATLNLGRKVAKGSEIEARCRVQRNVTPRNYMRVHVPPAAVLETRQVLDGMPSILKLIRINEVEGWLDMELVPASKSSSVNPYQMNRILRALIRAKIPIISFGPEEEHLEKMSLNLAMDVIR